MINNSWFKHLRQTGDSFPSSLSSSKNEGREKEEEKQVFNHFFEDQKLFIRLSTHFPPILNTFNFDGFLNLGVHNGYFKVEKH